MVHLFASLGDLKRKKVLTDSLDWSCLAYSLGPHLTVGDLLRFDTRRAAAAEADEQRLLSLAFQYNQIREAWNGPLQVVAAFCPEPYSREQGRPANCLHASGMALDLVPLDSSVDQFHRWMKKRWSGGLVRHPHSVHIDMRNNGRFSPRANLKPTISWI